MDNPFDRLDQRLARIETLCDRLIEHGKLQADFSATQRPITIEQVSELTHAAVATIRGWTSKRLIPFHKRGKRVLFFEDEVIAWVRNGRRLTRDECATEAENSLVSPRQKGARNGK